MCSHFHFTYEFVYSGISFQNLLIMSSSVPISGGNQKEKEEEGVDLTTLLSRMTNEK